MDNTLTNLGTTDPTLVEIVVPVVVGLLLIGVIITAILVIHRRRSNPEYTYRGTVELLRRSRESVEIPLSTVREIKDVQVIEKIGAGIKYTLWPTSIGNYGEVFYGLWLKKTAVAMKHISDKSDLRQFQQESMTLR